jgi:MFS family permease
LALGALGTAVASVMGGFLTLALWQMPLVIGGIVLMISGPSMLIAYLKLRQRNLAPILDAGGWAVNTKARINIPFGATLTKLAELPQGAKRSLVDPFAEKKAPWKRWAVLLALFVALGMAWDKGYIQKMAANLKPLFSSQETNATPEAPAQTAVPANQTADPGK